jgi:hypothetical protein
LFLDVATASARPLRVAELSLVIEDFERRSEPLVKAECT